MRTYKHLEYKAHIACICDSLKILAPNMTGIQFRAVGAGVAAAALLGLARFGSKLLKYCNFIPTYMHCIRNDLRKCKIEVRGACPTPPSWCASCTSTAPISFKTCCQINRKLLPTGLQLEYACSLGPGRMCNSYDVVHVLTFWCNYICNAPPKSLTVGNH